MSLKRKYVNDHSYPVLIDWTISKEELIKNNHTWFGSQHFPIENLPEFEYFLQIQQKRIYNSREETWIYLELNMPAGMKIIVDANFLCETANFDESWTHIFSSTEAYGRRLCLFTELYDPAKKFIVDNRLVVSVKAMLNVVKSDPIIPKIFKDESLGWQLWDSEEDKDATIVVNGMEIKAHKCVLKRRSRKFACLLKVKLEASENPADKIIIEKYTYDTVKEAIMFCYDIQSTETLSADDAINIMEFAYEYQINDLKKNMENFCIEHLSVSNACAFANTSISLDAEKLYRKCFDFLFKCMKSETAVKDIEKLDIEMGKKLLYKGFTKNCKSESAIFDADSDSDLDSPPFSPPNRDFKSDSDSSDTEKNN